MGVELIGYCYSVYLRIARGVLLEKGVGFTHVEVDPFAETPEWYVALHPFGRVPVLRHGDFVLYETAAIARYAEAAFGGVRLVPEGARAAARMQQAIGIVDSYGYRPMVRQVFAHAVFRPRMGEVGDAGEVAAGLAASAVVLGALEGLMEGDWLAGGAVSLADLHLGPMMAYFVAAPEGEAMLAGFPKLAGWWGVGWGCDGPFFRCVARRLKKFSICIDRYSIQCSCALGACYGEIERSGGRKW